MDGDVVTESGRTIGRRLLGREVELAAVDDALTDALGGSGRLVLVVGEAGIGKTELAAAAAARSAERGAVVLWGGGVEEGGAPAYWPWTQIIRSHLRQTSLAHGVQCAGRDVALLAKIVPEFGTQEPAAAAEPARFMLFDAVSGFLARAAATPLVIVVDDLHAAGTPSALLLQFLARELRQTSILLVCTYRPSEARLDPAMADVVATLETIGTVVAPAGLGEAEIATVLERETHTRPSPSLVAAIRGRTDGNPLFVGEVARLLRSDSTGREHWPVPAGIRQAIRGRFAALQLQAGAAGTGDAERIFGVAAVVGREFDLATVSSIADVSPSALLALVSQATEADLLRPVASNPGRYRFAHALVRDTVYEDTPAVVRAELHARIGGFLEQQPDDDAGAHLAALAHHFVLAVPLVDAAKAAEAARRAGDHAMQTLAFEEAAQHFDAALTALEQQVPACEIGRPGEHGASPRRVTAPGQRLAQGKPHPAALV